MWTKFKEMSKDSDYICSMNNDICLTDNCNAMTKPKNNHALCLLICLANFSLLSRNLYKPINPHFFSSRRVRLQLWS